MQSRRKTRIKQLLQQWTHTPTGQQPPTLLLRTQNQQPRQHSQKTSKTKKAITSSAYVPTADAAWTTEAILSRTRILAGKQP